MRRTERTPSRRSFTERVRPRQQEAHSAPGQASSSPSTRPDSRLGAATQHPARGGHVANIGLHGRPAALQLETMCQPSWSGDVMSATGLVETYSAPAGSRPMAAHHDNLDQFMEAYRVFAVVAQTVTLKGVLARCRSRRTLSPSVHGGVGTEPAPEQGPEGSPDDLRLFGGPHPEGLHRASARYGSEACAGRAPQQRAISRPTQPRRSEEPR